MFAYLCSDINSLGRMDSFMLSDHQRLELFFPNYSNERSWRELKGDADDTCTWQGVSCDRERQNVHSIQWHSNYVYLRGKVHFAVLPPHIWTIDLLRQQLQGTAYTQLRFRQIFESFLSRTQPSVAHSTCPAQALGAD